MKIAASGLPGTAFPTPGKAPGRKADDAAQAGEDPDSRRLGKALESLRQLGAGLNPKQMARKAASDRIGMLQRRLQELKQMLLHATPEQAKALARELKSIAGELGAAARAAGVASRGSQGNAAAAPAASDAAAASAAAGAAAASQSAETTQSPAGEDAGAGASAAPGPDDSGDAAGIPDKVLKNMLKDARKLLKEAIDMLRHKLGHGDRESARNLEEAQKKLQELGLATETQQGPASLYTSLGVGMPDSGGTSINVAA